MEDGQIQLFVDFLPGTKEKANDRRTGIFIPALEDEPALDPVLYLQSYRSRIFAEGSTDDSGAEWPLWVSSRKPHGPVKPVTLANWLKKVMEKGGVDITKYKAHSVRAAAPAHFRKEKSLSLVQILARGGWKASAEGKSVTFVRFYERFATKSRM